MTLAGAASVVLYGLGLILGIASGGSQVVFLAGAVSGSLGIWLPSGLRRSRQVLGALFAAGAAVTWGVLTGFGWLEASGIAGSLLLGLWTVRPRRSMVPSSLPMWVVGGVAVAFVVYTLVPLALAGGTLGHDESAYALKGRSWLEGTPDTGWGLHRGVAMSWYAYVVLGLGAEEGGLRLLGVAATIGFAVATWALASRISNNNVGAISAVAVVAGPAVLRRGTEFLSDIPSAALLLACMLILWRTVYEPATPSYRLLWLLPLAWTAFYLRYQSIISLGMIGLTVLVLWWPKIRARPGPLIAMVSLGGVGLIPHALFAAQQTGAPWGILTNTGLGAIREFLGVGLIDYAGLLAWRLGGFVGPLAAIAFLVGAWRLRKTGKAKTYLFLLFPAVAQVLLLGIISHGEARFVFFPFALTVVGGTMVVYEWLFEARPAFRRPLVSGLIIVLIGSMAVSAAATRGGVGNRGLANETLQMVSEEVGRAANGARCGVLTSSAPQVTFYSRCATEIFRDYVDAEEAVARLQGPAKFMILVEGGKRQPEGDDLGDLTELAIEGPVLITGGASSAAIYVFAD